MTRRLAEGNLTLAKAFYSHKKVRCWNRLLARLARLTDHTTTDPLRCSQRTGCRTLGCSSRGEEFWNPRQQGWTLIFLLLAVV